MIYNNPHRGFCVAVEIIKFHRIDRRIVDRWLRAVIGLPKDQTVDIAAEIFGPFDHDGKVIISQNFSRLHI